MASAEYAPCFQFARIERASPISVRGPVLVPPCIRQRPFCIAGPLQAVPFRVLAPQRGAVLGSPTGLPFFSHPRRFAWGSCFAVIDIPHPPVPASGRHHAHNGLTTTMNMYVLYLDLLLSFAPIHLERLDLLCKSPEQQIG